jgi:NAD(P)-dependent dehydrogenase (short-subunit alcohol dehydrogenase family)
MTQTPSPGRVALITGASRGIGAAIAIELARCGFTPVLAVRSPETAVEVARAVQGLGAATSIVRCDVADPADARRAIAETLATYGRLDVLINNAGVIDPIGRVGRVTPEAFARALQVNLAGPYNMIDAALPALQAAPQATLINISSGAAHGPREGWAAYCSSKAGLWMLTRVLAHEWGSDGIAVFGFQPGRVDTDMQDKIRASGINEVSRAPRSSLLDPARPARLVAWLAQTRPIDLNGQDLTIGDAALIERSGIDR